VDFLLTRGSLAPPKKRGACNDGAGCQNIIDGRNHLFDFVHFPWNYVNSRGALVSRRLPPADLRLCGLPLDAEDEL
jgi:hypothetical protein